MAERFEYILAKKDDACIKRSDVEGEKAERFNMLMASTEKKLQLEEKKTMLEEKKVEIATTSENSKMLTLTMENLDEDARMIVQAIRLKLLKCLKEQQNMAEKAATKRKRITRNICSKTMSKL